jgi:hypothetical protein
MKPERMREPAQQLVAPVMVDNRLADHCAQAGHPQIGAPGFADHASTA